MVNLHNAIVVENGFTYTRLTRSKFFKLSTFLQENKTNIEDIYLLHLLNYKILYSIDIEVACVLAIYNNAGLFGSIRIIHTL